MQVTRVQSQSQHVDVLNTKAELLHRLKGTIVHLPSLKPVFHNWKGIDTLHINPFYEPLRELVIVKLARYARMQIYTCNAPPFY
jgi:hypothetical protein